MNQNKRDWYRMVRTLAQDHYTNFSQAHTDEDGWTWIPVGHNASHSFYVGHQNYEKFAIQSVGEEYDQPPPELTGDEYYKWLDENNHCRTETRVYRVSGSLKETLDGAYYGHY